MRILVTGSAGHLGEGLVRRLRERAREVRGLDRLASDFTTHTGRLEDASFVRDAMRGVETVIHAATLHKPHLATHSKQAFVDTNVSGTLNVLEAAVDVGVSRIVFTSTTSAFGTALIPHHSAPAAWITEDVRGEPKNVYGITKLAAEDLCELFWKTHGLPCIVLRTSRFFPEADDDPTRREAFDDANLKVNEYLYRRVDLEDAVEAHLCAVDRADEIGFGRYIVSATTPFTPEHLTRLRIDAPGVVRRLVPEFEAEFARRGWKMLREIDRVYDNGRARAELGWRPRFDFRSIVERLRRGEEIFSALARSIGHKGYHAERFADGPYPVERALRASASRPSIELRDPGDQFRVVEVLGVDPRRGDEPDPELRSALAQHAVLCLRMDRALDDEELQAIARRFGPIKNPVARTRDGALHQYDSRRQIIDSGFVMTDEIRETLGDLQFGGLDDVRPGLFETFHCDDTYTAEPAWATVLHARELPRSGGGPTCFLDMRAAYEQLDADTKARIEGLQVRYAYNNEGVFPPRRAARGPNEVLEEVVHPLVRTHPVTGARALFMDLDRAKSVEGVPVEEGRALLRTLQDRAEAKAPRCEHAWRHHDVLVWDNASVQHKAGGDFAIGEARRFWRYMIAGGRPA